MLALLGANAISLTGSALTAVALPWFVLATTGSAARTGLAGAAAILPAFLVGVVGGPLVDRLGPKRVALAEDLTSAAAIALIPLLHLTIGLAFWQLLALVFVAALLNVPGESARYALLPDLAVTAGTRLERANAAFEGNRYLAALLGPTLAGLLIAAVGPSDVLWLDAATFAASAALIALAVPGTKPAAPTTPDRRDSYREEIARGLRFMRRDPLLRALAVGLAFGNLFGLGALFAVLLPVHAADAYGTATALGLLVTGQGAGQLLGAVVFGAVGHRLPRRALWAAGFLLNPLRYWVLALGPPLPAILAVLVAGGAVSGAFNPLLVTLRHERVPADLRGRVFASFSAVSGVAAPLGVILSGALVEGVGLRPAAAVLATISTAVGFLMLRSSALGTKSSPA